MKTIETVMKEKLGCVKFESVDKDTLGWDVFGNCYYALFIKYANFKDCNTAVYEFDENKNCEFCDKIGKFQFMIDYKGDIL